MKIYTNDRSKEMLLRVIERLLYEGNTGEQVELWAKSLLVLPLDSFDVEANPLADYDCIKPMLANGEVAYICQPDEDDPFVYVGRVR